MSAQRKGKGDAEDSHCARVLWWLSLATPEKIRAEGGATQILQDLERRLSLPKFGTAQYIDWENAHHPNQSLPRTRMAGSFYDAAGEIKKAKEAFGNHQPQLQLVEGPEQAPLPTDFRRWGGSYSKARAKEAVKAILKVREEVSVSTLSEVTAMSPTWSSNRLRDMAMRKQLTWKGSQTYERGPKL